jgi:hypothetical protein
MIDLFASEYGWTEEYIYSIRPYTKVFQLADAIHWRKKTENYQSWSRAALIASTIHNVNSKKRKKIEDFIGKPPKRKKEVKKENTQSLYNAAKEKGVKPPNG